MKINIVKWLYRIVYNLKEFNHHRFAVSVFFGVFAIKAVIGALFLVVGCHDDTYVATFTWYQLFNSVLVYVCIAACGAISDIKILVQMMKSVFEQCPVKILLGFSTNDAVACKTCYDVYPHSDYSILGNTTILPVPSYTPTRVTDDIIIELEGISV